MDGLWENDKCSLRVLEREKSVIVASSSIFLIGKLSPVQVDLISIDFSQKLPFRIKLPMVKAAIEVSSKTIFILLCFHKFPRASINNPRSADARRGLLVN